MEVLAIDRKSDIAILGKEIEGEKPNNIKVFPYLMGDSKELEWGSFVYIMGFPLGHAMITRGIVSDPYKIRKGSFLIDAVFNQGFSGGPVTTEILRQFYKKNEKSFEDRGCFLQDFFLKQE